MIYSRLIAGVTVALVLASAGARAADPSSPTDPHLQVTPVPGGVQLSNETFTLYLRTQVALEQCNLRIVARDAMLKDEAARAERSTWERHGFVIGIAVGFVVSTIAVWQVKGLLNK